jgi:hypothetical protein
MEGRLQKRWWKLVAGHVHTAQRLAAGITCLPAASTAFACTQAMWRFLANARVTLPALIMPPREAGRQAVADSQCAYALLVHDWSKLSYPGHQSKTDQTQITRTEDIGYEIYTALLVDADRGCPLAPMELELRAADGVHSTLEEQLTPPQPHLSRILPVMEAASRWGLRPRMVHVIDREADSVAHFRAWHKAEQVFLVRANDKRRVKWDGQSWKLTHIAGKLRQQGAFRRTRQVEYHGRVADQFVAETEVVLEGPAWVRTPKGQRRVYGERLKLRLVVAQVRGTAGQVLAQWLLFSNVPAGVSADQIALWYYWRWRIESFHKLLKGAGLEVEHWQQETAEAIAKRLLVASMACVTVWRLQQQQTPAALEFQHILVRLSGRQMKRTRPITTPALLHGLEKLLPVLALLQDYTPHQLRLLLKTAIPIRPCVHDTG